MPLFRIKKHTAKIAILVLQSIALLIAILWALSMGLLWFLSSVALFAAMGLMMIVGACLMIVPLLFVFIKFSKIAAGVTGLINTLWIVFVSLPVPSWLMVAALGFPWQQSQAWGWLTITFLIDTLSVVIILFSALFFMKGYIVEDVQRISRPDSEDIIDDVSQDANEEMTEEESKETSLKYSRKRSRST